MNNIPLSASRIKTLQTCSWLYYYKYLLKCPEKTNVGSLRGSLAHTVFEVLGNPRHKKHYNNIIQAQDINACEPIRRLVLSYCKKHNIDDFENLDLINKMILEGLNYDFLGHALGKPSEAISEKDFDITIVENEKNYRILGFIDKLFLYKKKKIALIRDFKTSKSIFSKEEQEDNMQNLMYCLAVKYLYPEFLKRKMEFLFLKFDCNGDGLISMEGISEDELEGFEYFLTETQALLNQFSEKHAEANMAYDMGFKNGFCGRTVCGSGKEAGELKKDGTPKWACPAKFGFDYYVATDLNGEIIVSGFTKEEVKKKLGFKSYDKIKKVRYEGCPRWNKKPLDNYDPFL